MKEENPFKNPDNFNIDVASCYRNFWRNYTFVKRAGSDLEKALLWRIQYILPIYGGVLLYVVVRIVRWLQLGSETMIGAGIGFLIYVGSIPCLVGVLHRHAVKRHYR